LNNYRLTGELSIEKDNVLVRMGDLWQLRSLGVVGGGSDVQIKCAGDTHPGRVRKVNEDTLLMLPGAKLFVVADGMGGHGHGEIASQVAVHAIERSFMRSARLDDEERQAIEADCGDFHAWRILTSIGLAHHRIVETSARDPRLKGMGTTLVAAYFVDPLLYVAHVGDSRAYVYTKKKLKTVTTDHSALNLFRDMFMDEKDVDKRFARFKHMVVRALGHKDKDMKADLRIIAPAPGDVVLLCSDGLTDEVPDAEIEAMMQATTDPARLSTGLVAAANFKGGRDNITVVLLKFGGKDPLLKEDSG